MSTYEDRRWDAEQDQCLQPEQTYGMCLACGSVEVQLNEATGTRDLTHIGEHHAYPTGYGCELCS